MAPLPKAEVLQYYGWAGVARNSEGCDLRDIVREVDYVEGKDEDQDLIGVEMEFGGHFGDIGEKWMIRLSKRLWLEEIGNAGMQGWIYRVDANNFSTYWQN